MEWNSLHKLVQEDCRLSIESISKGLCDLELYEPIGREKVFSELLYGDRAGICYIAPSGAGKSSLFCNVAKEWSKENLVFLSNVSMPLPVESSLSDFINERIKAISGIDLSTQTDEFITFLNDNKKKCVIMFDGIDECQNIAEMKLALHHTIVHFARGPFKIVMNCRSLAWKNIQNYTWLKSLHIIFWRPEEEHSLFREPFYNFIIQNYFKKYGVAVTLAGKALEMCRFPIALRLFSDAQREKPPAQIDTVRYMDLYIRYTTDIIQNIVQKFPDENKKSIAAAIDDIGLCFWKAGSSFCEEMQIKAVINKFTNKDGLSLYDALVENQLLRKYHNGQTVSVMFGHQLILEYTIASALFKQRFWVEKSNDDITREIKEILTNNFENQLLLPVLEFLYLVLELIGKHSIMIALFTKDDVRNDFKVMLCRAAAKMGQVDIETWRMLHQLETSADNDIKAEVSNTVYLLGENIPGDQVFHTLMLIQSKDPAALQRSIAIRLKYDSNLQMFVKQIQPYFKTPEIQAGTIEFVKRIRTNTVSTMRLPLLTLTDFIMQFNSDEGMENLALLAEVTKEDAAFLDAWVNVACDHSEKIFIKLIKIYINVVKNDRLKWDRIFRFCLSGGHKDAATALKLMVQGFENLNNHQLLLGTMNFISKLGTADPESACSLLTLGQKKAKFIPSSKQMELREKVAEAALENFKKNNRGFAKIISELAAGDDLKIKELITSQLSAWRKANPS